MILTRFIALSIVGLVPSAAWALGIRIADQSAEASARANAFAATADNPSAIYYNPAGIIQLDGTRVLLGTYAVTVDVSVDPKNGGSLSNSNHEWQFVPQAYFTWKNEKAPVALGLGLYSPYGLSLEYPDDSPFRTLAQKGKIQYLTINPVMALGVSRSFSIALGATINPAQAELSRGVLEEGDSFRFKGDGVAYGFNAGLLWKPHRMHRFGVNYRSATKVNLSGDSRLQYDGFDVATPFGPFPVPGLNRSEDASADFQFPQHIVLGYAFTPTEDWNFEFNFDWTDWDSLNDVTLKQSSGDVILPFNWKSSAFYEFGVTKKFSHGLQVSAGYAYSENSVPTESFNPIVPDAVRHIFSVGVGQRLKHVSWDLAYQYVHGPNRQIDQHTVADGTYRFDSHAIALTVGYTF